MATDSKTTTSGSSPPESSCSIETISVSKLRDETRTFTDVPTLCFPVFRKIAELQSPHCEPTWGVRSGLLPFLRNADPPPPPVIRVSASQHVLVGRAAQDRLKRCRAEINRAGLLIGPKADRRPTRIYKDLRSRSELCRSITAPLG
jgi:hypothetical protein